MLSLGLLAGVDSPKEARTAVLNCGLPRARNTQDLALMVSELVTNAVRHGTGPGGELILRVDLRRDTVHVEVEETGLVGWPPGLPGKAAPLDRAAGPEVSVGGWGLRLVEDLSDRWGVEEEPHRAVWFDLRLVTEG